MLRLFQQFLVDVIEWNPHLGNIVEQVLYQQMQRQHWQKRKERARHDNGEDVAEVLTGGHLDVLEHVNEGSTPFDHAFIQYHQAIFQQINVGGFLGIIDGGAYGNPDVGCSQGGGIIDAIAKKPHHMATVA